jgi:HlyD family type I secretion membrane fusion protein
MTQRAPRHPKPNHNTQSRPVFIAQGLDETPAGHPAINRSVPVVIQQAPPVSAVVRSNKERTPRYNDGAEKAGHQGWLILIGFFGLFGTWAAFAPLNGAIMAPGEVKVSGNRKAIQHLEGGIVSTLKVREGDTVSAGDALVELDDTQARTEHEVLAKLEMALAMTQARLQTEQEGSPTFAMPARFAASASDPQVTETWRGQAAQFEARLHESQTQAQLIKQRIGQLNSQIRGAQAQLASYRAQRTSMAKELATLKPLMEQGIVTRARLLQLERAIATTDGQIGEADNTAARFEQGISEQHQLDAQGRNQRATAISQELRDVQMRLAEALPKLGNARAVLERAVLRAPYAGRVVGLSVFGTGAVIGRGEKVMDIVPDTGALIVEARIPIEDINETRTQAAAEVRLTGTKQQTTPPLHGVIEQISADRLTDARTGAPYYAAIVRINQAELASNPEIKLHPGMGATVTVPTHERTALQYLLSPLWSSFHGAFRER